MKTKITIKSIVGKLLFEFEKEDNTIKDTVIEAVSQGAYLQGAYLQGAYLQGAYLRGAYLRGAYLQGAYLQDADLQGAYLRGAYLRGADLQGADLQGAYLQDADLQGAYLRGAYLRGADLQGADLRGADLQGAYLQGAYLQGAKGKSLEDLKSLFWIIPEEGSFIAFKKCENAILKLEIPANAKRTCNIKNRKCRAEFVNVLSIEDMEGNKIESAKGLYSSLFIYVVGMIYPDKYDDDYTNDCSNGIHFFLTKQEAIDYN